MKLQQWGTFSVKDHKKPRAFVAEVLLFDKLVIPRPATDEELYAEGQIEPRESQRDRWQRERWEPDRQRELLDVLQEFDLAVELPWGKQANQDFHAIFDTPSAGQLEVDRSDLTQSVQYQIDLAKTSIPEEAAYMATATVLDLYVAGKMKNAVARKLLTRAKTAGIPVEPVSAYGSFAEFSTDRGVQMSDGDGSAFTPYPYAMFGWEFFVPEDSHKSDAQLLRKAAKLASRPDFCETRQEFQGRLKQLYEAEVDQNDAYENMLKMLAEYTKIMRNSGLRTVARYAAKAAPIFAPLVGHLAHSANVGMDAGVAASSAALFVDRLFPIPDVPDRLRPAAMLYDARHFFHKHEGTL